MKTNQWYGLRCCHQNRLSVVVESSGVDVVMLQTSERKSREDNLRAATGLPSHQGAEGNENALSPPELRATALRCCMIPRMIRRNPFIAAMLWLLLFLCACSSNAMAEGVTFNLNFEGASLGQIEPIDATTVRCHVRGQHDERGRNRQATWYYFRMDHVAGKDLTVTLTDFVGKYHDKPGANPIGPDIVPVFSNDGHTWQHFPTISWDAEKKETTLKFRPERDSIWIAHVPPYTTQDLYRLLADLRDRPTAVVEMIGKTVQGRDIPMVTVTNPDTDDANKKVVWLQARQHAWEAGTSYVIEGALRFITSDDPAARDLLDKVVFISTPMVDLDGCANGQVRSNANGYHVNQHWRQVDLHPPNCSGSCRKSGTRRKRSSPVPPSATGLT
jgi:hypothetical protein